MRELQLASGGNSRWSIVVGHPAHETTRFAADELQRFLLQISGASLPVQTVLVAKGELEILVGRSTHVASHEINVNWESLGEEGFVLRSGENYILLAGATPRGTLYAVYAFLEKLGCRWFAPDCSRIPRNTELTVSFPDETQLPAFESREAYWREAFDGEFAARNRMNSNKADISSRRGGHLKFYNFHHSFNDLIDPEIEFDAHPEFFSMVEGERRKERTQLCLSNPEVLHRSIQRVREWIRDNPDCQVFSVAQNDWDNHCTCPECRAFDEKEGSPAGSLIRFVNQVAEEIEKDYPRVLIHTFAYQYTRKAPRTVRPRKNVIVRLCSIECCFSHPLDGSIPCEEKPDGPHPQCAALGEKDFLQDLEEWSRITEHLYVWDYVTQFRNYLLPMPNFDVLGRNLRLFHRMGVKGVLEQGNFSHGGQGHLAELEAYLQAKLLWNPDQDQKALTEEFLEGFYGEAAAPYIRKYIDCWQLAARNHHVSIFENSRAAYISDETIGKAEELLNQALFRSPQEPFRKRLLRLRLSMTYLILARMPENTPGRNILIDRFGWELRELGITEIHERWTLEESLEEMKRIGNEREQRRTVVNDYKM